MAASRASIFRRSLMPGVDSTHKRLHHHSEEFLRGLMKRQLKLSISCAAAFLLLLFGLPVMNYLAPELMARRVGGFTLTWLVLGVLFFPYVWIIAKWFIVRSIALENAEVKTAGEQQAPPNPFPKP
jgi:uncharacterized membrane protein (DUF485 family)